MEQIDTKISNINVYLDRYKKIESKKHVGGINDPKTEIRALTLKLINSPKYPMTIGGLGKITKGWTSQQLWETYKIALDFTKNPGAMWWILWKKNKDIYGKNKKKIIQETLF